VSFLRANIIPGNVNQDEGSYGQNYNSRAYPENTPIELYEPPLNNCL
jgi:hypothetical protein